MLLQGRRQQALAGKIVLLTGGSRGLGLQLARVLAREKCRLILVARDQQRLERTAAELRASGAEVSVIACDLSDEVALEHMIDRALAIYGEINIIINNAGRIVVGPIDSFEKSEYRASMDLMFWAPVRITLKLLPHLLHHGNSDIVNIASIGGRISVPHMLPYSCAKFALVGFSHGADSELRPRGIHVLTVTPGLMRTGSHKHALFTGDAEKEYQWFSLGATVPGVAMNVNRAAEQIVNALKHRRHSLTITWSAQLASRFHGAFPETACAAVGLAQHLLPAPNAGKKQKKGYELEAQEPALIGALTALGEVAAERQAELPIV
jgi:short-subunit dehydrogenase